MITQKNRKKHREGERERERDELNKRYNIRISGLCWTYKTQEIPVAVPHDVALI